jgi:protoporphyrinogen/coproporphyrinogen III oxidase
LQRVVTSYVPVLIVGGGVSGLVCAYALRKAGFDAQLTEASARTGGLIRSERRDGYLLEMGPQSFSGTPPLRELCNELGIQSELMQAPPSAPRYVLVDRALQPVPLTPPAFLMSSLLSGATKRAIAADVFGNSQPPAQDESVADFVRRKFSAELLEKLAGPFISGIYAGDPERLSVRSAFPQLHEAEKTAGSVIRGMKRMAKSGKEKQTATLLSFREGVQTLITALSEKLGTALHINTEVLAVRREVATGRFTVQIRQAGQSETFTTDHLLLATPTDVAAKLAQSINPGFESLLGAIEYAPVGVVSLGYERSDVGHSLNGFGFLVPRSAGLRVLGTVWNSSLFRGRAPEGKVLLTSFVGGATDPSVVDVLEANLVSLVQSELASLLTIRQQPVFSNVTIYPRALPQYNLGHSERLAAVAQLHQDVPNLWFVGNYLRGPSIGACVEHSLAVAEEVRSQLLR